MYPLDDVFQESESAVKSGLTAQDEKTPRLLKGTHRAGHADCGGRENHTTITHIQQMVGDILEHIDF
jgi:hypothetical protein